MDLVPKLKSSTCCKGCEKRYVGCHSKCKLYLEYRSKLNDFNEKIKKEKYKERLGYGPGYIKAIEDIKSGKYAKK